MLPSSGERKLARELASLRSDIDTVMESLRTPQLSNSTLIGAIPVRDTSGALRSLIGQQADGTFAVVNRNGPAPDRPSTPIAVPSPNGLIIEWNGQLVSGVPADFSHCNVYVSEVSGAPTGGPVVSTAKAQAAALIADRLASGLPLFEDWTWSGGPALVGAWNDELIAGYQAAYPGGPLTGPTPIGWLTTAAAETVGGGGAATANLVGSLNRAGKLPVGPLVPGRTYYVKLRAASSSLDDAGNPILGVESFETSGVAGSVVASSVIAGLIDTLALAAEAVTKAKIAANAVDGTKIEPNSISSPHIVAQAIQALHMAADSIQAGAIAADVITAREMAALSIVAEHINTNAINAGHLQAGIIDADKLAAMLVLATRIILGNPIGARLEIDATGLDQFDDAGSRTMQFGANPSGGNFLTIVDPLTGGSLAAITDNGVMTAQSFLVAGSLSYQGDELETRLSALPKGMLAWGTRSIGDFTTGMTGIMELEVSAEPYRVYRISHSACFVEPAAPGAQPTAQGEMRLHYTLDGSRPTTSSRVLGTTGRSAPGDYGGLMSNFGQVQTGATPVRIRVLLTYQSHFGQSTRFITGGYDNGLLFWIEDVGPTVQLGGVSSTGGGTGTTATTTYVREYPATWSRSWNNGGAAVRFSNGELVQGYYNDGVNGDQMAAFGFDDATIRNALSGGTITAVDLFLYAHHWYWNSGGYVRIRTHNSAATDIYPAVSATVDSEPMGKPEGKWIRLPNSVGDGFRNGTVRGFALDSRDVARDLVNYGRFDGIGWGSPPKLRITYRNSTAGSGGGVSSPVGDVNPPTNFDAVWNANNTVTTTWTVGAGADSTEVFEFLTDPNDTLKGTIPAPGTQRISNPLVAGNTYAYAIRSRKGSEVSTFTQTIRISNTAKTIEATTAGGAGVPTNVSAVLNPDKTVTTNWTPTPGSTATEVHEMLATPSATLRATVPVPGATRTSGVLTGGRDYAYAVRAVFPNGVSAFSSAITITVPAEGGGGGTPTTGGSVPGSVYSMARWYLTLPIADPSGTDASGPWDVYNPELATFKHSAYFFVDGAGWVNYVAPVAGVTTSASSGATRSELREMVGPTKNDKANWGFGDGNTHVLEVTLTCDATSISGRKEVIVGQIHDATGTPPIYLCVNQNSSPGKLTLFKNGPAVGDLLTGITATTVFSYRIEVSGTGSSRRCKVFAGLGSTVPSTPQFSFPTSDFAAQSSGNYLKAGAYNKEPISGSGVGRSIVRHQRLVIV